MIEFFKYQGAGNDFILVDDRSINFPAKDYALIARMCDRHFGIGSDGLMLLQNALGYDFKMLYYNADGRPGSMCGNGGRCIARFARDLGIIDSRAEFLAVDGPHIVEVLADGRVSLRMSDLNEIKHHTDGALLLDTGSPHYVNRVSSVSNVTMPEAGRAIRYSEAFAENGINVNFVEWKDGMLYIRTYERGVEAETLACGTGVTAAAIAAHHWGMADSPVRLRAMGGELEVSFDSGEQGYTNIVKTGPAVFVFKGMYTP